MDTTTPPLPPRDAALRLTGGGRDDCWSEDATATLIEAWGDRYVKLNRGNLRQKDWKEVADAVNVHRHGINKAPRTDIQCKNRIDTLKKKYKVEKFKPSPSTWRFFAKLNELIGPNSKKMSRISIKSSKSKRNPNPSRINNDLMFKCCGSSDIKEEEEEDEEEEEEVGFGMRECRMEYVDFSEESAYKELARAILRFGEVYERIESSKQVQMMELEKERMEFTRELEVQRMNMFMDAQVEIERMKSGKGASRAGKKL